MNVSIIVRDKRTAALLEHRLDEARARFANGAHVTANVMLGSLLEGEARASCYAPCGNETPRRWAR